eukprot:COSAG05_NODE_1674_length_4299_cov_4.620952_5_plen_126_part_00
MLACGATSLGFIGIALSAVVETTHPVSSELSGGTVERWVQIWGFVLSEAGGSFADGQYAFPICGAATWLVTLLMFTGYRQEFNKSHRGRPRKVKGKTEGQRTEAEILQGLEARAAQMDEDTSLAW